MRNDSAKWQAALGVDRPAIVTERVSISLWQPRRQTLISGPYVAALELAGLDKASGWPEMAGGGTYSVRLRRDRILVVNGDDMEDGWNDARGLAVSDMTDGYAVIDLEGKCAFGVLQRGTEIDLASPSASVARGFHGYATLIYRRKPDSYRIHVGRAYLEGFWGLLQTLSQKVDT